MRDFFRAIRRKLVTSGNLKQMTVSKNREMGLN